MSREQRTPVQRVFDFGPGARAKVALSKSATFFRRNPAAAFSLGFLVFMAVVSTVLAPIIATHDPKVVAFPDKLDRQVFATYSGLTRQAETFSPGLSTGAASHCSSDSPWPLSPPRRPLLLA